MRIGLESSRRAIVAALLAASGAQAAQAAEQGFYVGVSAGQTDYDVARGSPIFVQINSPFGGGVMSVWPESTRVEDDELSWTGTLGYRIHTYVAAELAYMSFGEADVRETYEIDAFGPFGASLTIDQRTRVKVSGPAISLLGILPLGAGWEVYLRAGVLFADQKNELIFPSSSQEMTFGSEEWLAGAGVQWTFARRWGLRLEYQRIDTIEANLRNGEMDLDQISLGATFAL